MTDNDYLGFVMALGQEFCEVLTPVVGFNAIVPQDAYELFIRAFDNKPTPEFLTSLSDSQLELLRLECERYFECDGLTVEQIREAARRALIRWDGESTRPAG